MIKLIATDIDGTLLVEGSDALNPEIYDVIRKLKDKGVVFAAASGRSYTSIRRLFKPVAEDMIFVSDNGANVICRGYEMYSSQMDRQVLRELVEEVRPLEDCYWMFSGREGKSYVEDCPPEFEDLLVNGYHNEVVKVKDIFAEPVDIIKCAIYKKEGIRKMAPYFIEKYRDRLNVALAGDIWLDFMDYSADKGLALGTIQKTLKISREETMAFGDNMNDIGMLGVAGESYAVANARSEVKAAAKHIAEANVNDGVLKVMKSVLERL